MYVFLVLVIKKHEEFEYYKPLLPSQNDHMIGTLGVRRALPWFGAGTVVGIFGSQFLKDLFVLERQKIGSPEEVVVQTDNHISPHYPADRPLPSYNNIVVRPAFTTSMNYRTKEPDWVAEMLTADLINTKNGERKNSQFKGDPDIPDRFKASNADYWDSGWSRGHLAASASHRHNQAGQDSTFLLNSNIVPQDLSMNGCDWNRLEVLVRDLANAFPNGRIYVLSGPAWVPESDTPFTQRPFSKNKVIMYEVLGKNNVHVPTHMFKVIRLQDMSQGVDATAAFIMPNRPIREERPIQTFMTDLDSLEIVTGFDLSGMRSSSDLCTIVRCEKSTNRRMLGWRHYGLIDESRNIDELRISVKKALADGFIDGDNFLIAKIVRDRMRDLGLGDHVEKLFPSDKEAQDAVRRGIETFTKRNAQVVLQD
jgi:DNA/RNA endonuclease G (NUC1)